MGKDSSGDRVGPGYKEISAQWVGLGGRPHLNMPIRAGGDGRLRESIFGVVPSFPFHSVLFTDFLSGPSMGKCHPSGLHGGCWEPLALPLLSALPCIDPLGAKGKIVSMSRKSLCIWSLPASQLSSPPSPHSLQSRGPPHCS